MRALYTVPVLALLLAVAGGVGQGLREREGRAAAYERGAEAAAAGDHLTAIAAFADAAGHADAEVRRQASLDALAPLREAYEAGIAALAAGDYAHAIASLHPVARALPGFEDAVGRLADARRLERERLWRLAEAAESRGEWIEAERLLRQLAALDPTDPQVAERLAAIGRDHGPLVLTRDRGLWLVSPDGAEQTALAENAAALWPAWSPDRTRVAYFSIAGQGAAGQVELLVVDTAGGTPRRLAGDASAHTAPIWSPDGRYLAFTSFAAYDPILDAGPIGVHVVEVDTGREIDVTGSRFDLAFNPAWGPDSSRLAFVVKDRDLNQRPQHAPGDVYLTTLGSDEFVNLTKRRAPDVWSVAWRPDGGELLVYSLYGQSWYEPPRTAIRSLDPATGALTLVIRGQEMVRAPVWSPDGRRYAFVVGDRAIHVVDATGTYVVDGEHNMGGELAWSPDGSVLLAPAMVGSQPSTLVSFDPATGPTVSSIAIDYDAEPPYFGPPQWAPATGPTSSAPAVGVGLDRYP